MPHIHELYDFTASAFIMHPTEKKLLLIDHVKLGSWLQPGGHIELNEDPLQALSHELEEETGLKPQDYTIIEPAEHPTSRGVKSLPTPFYVNVHDYDAIHKHIDLTYLVKAKVDVLTDHPDGARGIGWFDMQTIRDMHAKKQIINNTLDTCEWIAKNYFA